MQSLQGRDLEAQSNIQCYNAVMNPIGKAGLFVNGFVRWRDGRKCWIELGQSAMFGQLIIWDVTNQCLSKRQSLSSELKNTWTLKMSSLYVTFFKMKRQCWEHWCSGISGIQIWNWIQILPLSGSCSIFCFCSFWDCCRVHNSPVIWSWKKLGEFYGYIRRKPLPLTLQLHQTLWWATKKCFNIPWPEESSGNSGWYSLWDAYWEFLYAKLEKNLAHQKIKLSACYQDGE